MIKYKEKTKYYMKITNYAYLLLVTLLMTGCVGNNKELFGNNADEAKAYIQYIKGERIAIIDGEETRIGDNPPAKGAPYCIIDLNSDGIRELIINRHDDWPEVFCYDGKNVIDAELGAYPTLSNVYFSNDGYAILEDKNHGGRFGYSVLKLNNGKYEEVETLEHWFSDNYSEKDDELYLVYPAGINTPDEITDEEYEKKLNNYINNILELEYVCPN